MGLLRSIAKRVIGKNACDAIERKALTLWCAGNRFECPCCCGHFRRFLPKGPNRLPRRPNAMCPACKSFERHRLLWLYLKNKTNLLTDKLSLLHFAPEPTFKKKLSAIPDLEYTSADICSPLADVKTDITGLVFEDNKFDVIICCHVLEHVNDDAKAMRELFRVLKPGGWAIIQAPYDSKKEITFEDPSATTPAERARLFGQGDHLRIYGRDYSQKMETAGFKVTQDTYVQTLPVDLISKYSLFPDEDIFYCEKPAP